MLAEAAMLTTFLFTLSLIAIQPDVPLSTAMANVQKYLHTVAVIESDLKQYARNPNSTASSYFQITDDTFTTMKNRARRIGWEIDHVHVTAMTYEAQAALVWVNWHMRPGARKYLKHIAEGDQDAMKAVYRKYHHTNPDAATERRLNQIFRELWRTLCNALSLNTEC